MLKVRFSLILNADTDDEEDACQEVLDFIDHSNEGWYATVSLDGKMTVLPADNEE